MTTPSAQRPSRLGVGEHLRVEADVEALADEAARFITQPWPRPWPKASLHELASPRNRFLAIEVLEVMVLDGVARRDDVLPFVQWCLAEWEIGRHSNAEDAALADRHRARRSQQLTGR